MIRSDPERPAPPRGLLPGLVQLRATASALAVATARTEPPCSGIDAPQAATTNTGNGGWFDGSCLDLSRVTEVKFEPILSQSMSG